MLTSERILLLVVAVLSLAWHAITVQSAWESEGHGRGLRDFASYYYADAAADAGKDPYVVANARGQARADLVLSTVHPFFYPPPFLWLIDGLSSLSPREAYRAWFWLNELAVLGACLALIGWWRDLGDRTLVLIPITLATLTAIENNLVMGQANLPVLALVIAAAWAEERGRSPLAGALLGLACMLKMSPALIVAWWLLRRRWHAAAWAIGAAVALSLVSLLSVPLDTQVRFYREVLPTFGSGDYNGLAVPIGLFGNHSLPDLYNLVFPGGGRILSPAAQSLSSATALALPALTLWRVRGDHREPWTIAAQLGALCTCMLLIPVYTYEHHVVFAIPAAVAAAGAVLTGRLPRGWTLPVLLAWALWAAPLQAFKSQAQVVEPAWAGLIIEESKFTALLVFYAACMWLAAGPRPRT